MLRTTVRMAGPLDGTPYFSITHHIGEGSTAASAAQSKVMDFWGDLAPSMGDGLVISVVESALVAEPTGQKADEYPITAAPVEGSATAELLPPSNQALLRLKTGIFLGGRQVSGRIFVPALNLDASDGGRLNPATPAILEAAVTNNLIGTDDGDLQVYSKKNGAAYNVTSVSCWEEWAVLRSRRD